MLSCWLISQQGHAASARPARLPPLPPRLPRDETLQTAWISPAVICFSQAFGTCPSVCWDADRHEFRWVVILKYWFNTDVRGKGFKATSLHQILPLWGLKYEAVVICFWSVCSIYSVPLLSCHICQVSRPPRWLHCHTSWPCELRGSIGQRWRHFTVSLLLFVARSLTVKLLSLLVGPVT